MISGLRMLGLPQMVLVGIVLLVMLIPTAAGANDTEASVAAGGLVFRKSHSIEMRSEELFVSMDRIVVKYVFYNHSANDVSTLIAFPLPPSSFSNDDVPLAGEVSGFKTLVDGKLIEHRSKWRASIGNDDVADLLQELGVPFDPLEAGEYLLEFPDKQGKLRKQGLVNEEGEPLWVLQVTFFWNQVFRADAFTEIEHSYAPVVGGSAVTMIDGLSTAREVLRDYRKFCVDEAFLRAVELRKKRGEVFSEHIVEYVLKTGANWRGPIRDFRLLVDKGDVNNLVSFCGDGVRKIDARLFETRATNFVPERDLAILILRSTEASVDLIPQNDLLSLNCRDLWVRRNSIFKEAGYCFKTPRAIAEFGNAGCTTDNLEAVAISDTQRGLVARMREIEKMKGCSK